jgi:tRNA pseudouridine38-40 synthase
MAAEDEQTVASPRRCLTLAYDGARFAGWAVQPDQVTIQGVLEEALGEVLGRGESVRVVGSGRTDKGVHARGQVAHFDDTRGLPLERLGGALAGLLPGDIRPVGLVAAPVDFHARHSAVRKTYVYQLHLSRASGGMRAVQRSVPPHRRRTHVAVPASLDLGAMREAARHLVGRHDFTTFSKVMSEDRGTVKTVQAVRVLASPRGVRLVVTGDGFLYGMVRLLSAALVAVGRGQLRSNEIPAMLRAADRSLAPASLPGHALSLWRVDYSPDPRGSARRRGLLS